MDGMGAGKGGRHIRHQTEKARRKNSGAGIPLAFAAPSRQAVDMFYRAALKHGGKDNGPAGLQSEYGPHYYAAFVFDPDGYRIEAVINYTYDKDGYRSKAVTR
jgi:hypothetical protein